MEELHWRTKLDNLNKNAKILFLGSYTSQDGADYFYYMSRYNQFYKILSLLIYGRDKINEYKGKGIKEIDKLLKDANLIDWKTEIRKIDKTEDQREEIRKKIRAELAKNGFEICDLFLSVARRNSSSLDKDILIEDARTKRTNLIELLTEMKSLKCICCTSEFVKKHIAKHDIEFIRNRNIDIVCLDSPSPSKRIKVSEKAINWAEHIPA